MNLDTGSRIKITHAILFVFGALLIARLFSLQVLSGDYYNELADKQYIEKPNSAFKRGNIYFKKKDGGLISAAVLKEGFVLAINPKLIKDADGAYEKLSQIIDIDERDFLARASKKNDPYEEIAHKIGNEDAKKIKQLGISGVNVYPESWRFYPGKNLASKVLGFVGYKGDKFSGRYGLERYYENILKRSDKNNININFFAEILGNIKRGIFNEDNGQEGDIILTVEPLAQSFLENALKEVLEIQEAKLVGGLIINPKTGAILAMSAKPDFNPNFYGQFSDLSLFLNPSVEGVYEMGSTMKALTIAAALNEGKISSGTEYYDNGFVEIEGRRIENYDGKGRGKVDMQTVLNKSLNTGAVFAMQSIGGKKFREYLMNYGFGSKTGIDLPDEISGLVSNLDSGREIEYATASFGHGIAITPIEMATALSSLANGGNIIRPYIVDEIKIKNNRNIKIQPEILRRVLKEETSEEISRMLSEVFDKALLGGTVKIDRYSIAAKTGTAELLGKDGEYEEGRYFHSFFGYFPAFDAKFLIFLYVIDPLKDQYASGTLTAPFMNIVKFLINYYEIQPDS